MQVGFARGGSVRYRIAMSRLTLIRGIARYEFRMQARRRSVWVILLGIGLLTLLLGLTNLLSRDAVPASASEAAVRWATLVNILLPVGLGILLADRLPRDEQHNVSDLLDGLPPPLSLRLLGKYVGATAATILPILGIYAVGLVAIVARWQDLAALPVAVLAFATINLPGILFVAAFSVACPLVMPVPVYQVLYTGYWFWGNLLTNGFFGIPTLSRTILTPEGQIRAGDLFGVELSSGSTPQPWLGVASIVALLLCAAVALYAAWRILRWREARR